MAWKSLIRRPLISTHTPLAGRDPFLIIFFTSRTISTHTPLAGRDVLHGKFCCILLQFLLTRPSRGATPAKQTVSEWADISTHTPLAGRDKRLFNAGTEHRISTHTPLAGRDCIDPLASTSTAISTHTPLAGRDLGIHSMLVPQKHFYSHAPRGARPKSSISQISKNLFLLTRPSRGATGSGLKAGKP